MNCPPIPHPLPVKPLKRGVLLVNLGTPDALDFWSIRRYLKEFLSDRRVIEVPRALWWVILNGIILTFRPRKTAKAYAAIWDKARNASPFRVITESQTTKLQAIMGDGVLVHFAMRYGQPGIRSTLDAMMADGCRAVDILPLYPQYSAATVATVVDEVAAWLTTRRFVPAVNIIGPYYDAPVYVGALAESVRASLKNLGWKPDVIVASFHGMPLAYCQKGDPYYCHSHKTARLLAETLGSPFCTTVHDTVRVQGKKPPLLMAFQSRFGRAEWLRPYMADVLPELARAGVKNVLVICPGFAADCVETLEEIAMGGREAFLHAGGTQFAMVPCLNDSAAGMRLIRELVG